MSDEIVIASTTQSPEEIKQALGIKDEPKKEDEKPAEAKAQEQAGEQERAQPEEEQQATPKSEEQQPDKPRSNKKLLKRIDALTRERAERDRRIAELEAQIRPAQQPQAQTDPAQQYGKPQRAQFASEEDYFEALADYRFQQRMYQMQVEAAQRAEQEQHQEVVNNYLHQVNQARNEFEDFDEVVGRDDILIPQAARVAVMESPVGAKIAYYLGQHPDVCEEMHDMSPIRVAATIGKIEELVSGKTVTKPVRMPSKAPAPVQTVTGNAVKTTADPGSLPYREYRRLRDSGQL